MLLNSSYCFGLFLLYATEIVICLIASFHTVNSVFTSHLSHHYLSSNNSSSFLCPLTLTPLVLPSVSFGKWSEQKCKNILWSGALLAHWYLEAGGNNFATDTEKLGLMSKYFSCNLQGVLLKHYDMHTFCLMHNDSLAERAGVAAFCHLCLHVCCSNVTAANITGYLDNYGNLDGQTLHLDQSPDGVMSWMCRRPVYSHEHSI